MKFKKRMRPQGVTPVKAKKSPAKGRVVPGAGETETLMEELPGKNGILIMVIEDDQDHRDALTCLLESEGYEVSSAPQGLEAMERLRWGLRPAAILLDMRMQVMNGWEFRRELGRDRGLRSIPVLIMSEAALRPEDLEGCAGWIPKPVRGAALLKKLERCTRVPVRVR